MKAVRFLSLLLVALGLSTLFAVGCQRAGSGNYPSKPVEWIIHESPGGASDAMGRTMADILEKEKLFPQPVTVVNKPGGSGAVAYGYVAEKKGDPYVLMGAGNIGIATPLVQKLEFTHQDFIPLANFTYDKTVWVVRADSPIKTFKDLIAEAKKRPGQINQGAGSLTSTDNYIRGAVMKATGTNWKYVSFKQSSEATTALLGGNVDFASPNPSEALELVRAGKVRPIVATSKTALFPDVPSLAEEGVKYDIRLFRGVWAPKDIPADARKTLEDTFAKAVKTERFQKYVKDNDMDLAFMTGAEYQQVIDKIYAEYKVLTPELGITTNP